MNPKQQSLFGNLPQLNNETKEMYYEVLNRTKPVKRAKTTTVHLDSGVSTGLARKLSLLVEALRNRLVDKGEHEIIRTKERFHEYMAFVRSQKHLFPALDTETTGLDPIDDKVVGIGIYVPGALPVYIPYGHTELDGTLIVDQIAAEWIRDEMELCADEGVKWVYHNAPFDMRFMKNTFNLTRYPLAHWCTQLAANYLNENEPHQLKPLWDKYVSKQPDEESDVFNSLFKGIKFNYVPIELGGIYAAKDPKITHELFKFQEPFLTPDHPNCIHQDLVEASIFFHTTEMPLTEYVCEMEDEGVNVNRDKSDELAKDYNKLLNAASEKCQSFIKQFKLHQLPQTLTQKLGNPVNLSSPDQLSIIIYDYLRLPPADKKKPRGTGEEILEKLMEKHEEHRAFFKAILEYRGIIKLLSTYIEKFPQLVKAKTGKLHGFFKQYGAKTGRFSSKDPNLQNIPSRNKEIRKMIEAKLGWVLIGGDFSQQEPRVLAHLAFKLFGERKLMDAYLAGKDLYAWMASEVYKVSYEECLEFAADGTKNPPECKQRRSSVKDLVLGLMYGRSTKSVAVKLGIDVDKAQEIVDMLFNEFPAIKMVVEYYHHMVRERGYIKTVFGRKRRLPDYNLPPYEFFILATGERAAAEVGEYYTILLNNAKWFDDRKAIMSAALEKGILIKDNDYKIAEAERQILNSVVQGTGADITKKAMVLIGQDTQLREWGFKMLLTVHDELIGTAPEENALKCAERMQQLMLDSVADEIVVPMSVDCEIFRYWNGEDITEELRAA